MVMKGPAYVADTYPLAHGDRLQTLTGTDAHQRE